MFYAPYIVVEGSQGMAGSAAVKPPAVLSRGWRGAEKAGLTLEEWVSDAWAQANAMHTRFYEDWCTRGTWNKR